MFNQYVSAHNSIRERLLYIDEGINHRGFDCIVCFIIEMGQTVVLFIAVYIQDVVVCFFCGYIAYKVISWHTLIGSAHYSHITGFLQVFQHFNLIFVTKSIIVSLVSGIHNFKLMYWEEIRGQIQVTAVVYTFLCVFGAFKMGACCLS